MNVYLSIVSHQDTQTLQQVLQPHRLQSPPYRVIVRDNCPDPALADYCQEHNLVYCANQTIAGFGANHNASFRECRDRLGMNLQQDWFVVLNPDLECEPKALQALIEGLTQNGASLGAPVLFRDSDMKEREKSIRRFPYLWDLPLSFLFGSVREGVDRNTKQPQTADWASGACLAFKASLFESLNGFDERYFMYYEDVDICWRARQQLQIPLFYIPGARMVHKGQRASHRGLNAHLGWHLKSALRFSWVRLKTFFGGPPSPRKND